MKIHAQGFGKVVEPDGIKPGELFLAGTEDGDALCLSFAKKGEHLALILRTSNAGIVVPTARLIENLKPPFLRQKGQFAARPIVPPGGDLVDLPSRLRSGSGDLVISDDGELYIVVEEEAAAGLPAQYLIDLSSGDFLPKPPKSASRYASWELVSIRDSGHQDTLAQFRAGAAFLGDEE